MSQKDFFKSGNYNLIGTISKKIKSKEGEEAVFRVLREIYRNEKIGTKDLARLSRLPIPIVAAIRRELEKEGLLERRGGATLTDKGHEYVTNYLGIHVKKKLTCPLCDGKKIVLTDDYSEILHKLREYSHLRPIPLTEIDQAFGTPETALLRTLYMLEEGDLEGKKIIFLGDDDLTSISTGLLRTNSDILTIDIDGRLLDIIKNISEKEKLNITCILHDLRYPLPRKLLDKQDVVFTDPPYTLSGIRLFLSRAIQTLKKSKTGSIYVAYADKSPKEMLEIHKAIVEMGLFIKELIPRFNVYEGAEIFANTTSQFKLTTTQNTKPFITGKFEGKLYTGEIKPTIRLYKCKCGNKIDVGQGKIFTSIEELKMKGCPHCGINEGFRLLKKTQI